MSSSTMQVNSGKNVQRPRHAHGGWPFRGLFIASTVSLILLAIAGVMLVADAWFVARRYSAANLIPWSIGFQVIRERGASAAALVTSLHITAILHRRAPTAHLTSLRRFRTAILAGFSVPIAYVPVCAVILGTAMLSARVSMGLAPREFVHLLDARDWKYGFMSAIALGLIPALWSVIGGSVLPKRRGLAFKLLITWFVAMAFSAVVKSLFSVIGCD